MPTTPTDIQVPGSLPVLPGVALSGRYLLTDVAPINRGDTLDAFLLPDGRLAAMVGDVVGHGFTAAIAMTQLRTVLRERLLEGRGPAETLASLHRLAAHIPDVTAARLAVVVLDGAASRVDYVAAGHPPPVVWRPGGARVEVLDGSRGRPLGAFGPIEVGRTRLEDGAALLLHTDGLTSGGAVSPDAVGAALAREMELANARHSPFLRGDAVCEGLLGDVGAPSAYLDDVAVLLLQRMRPPRVLSCSLPAVAASVTRVRGELSTWLEEVGAGLADQVGLCHAVGELARNVVDHAYLDGATAGGLGLSACLDDEGHAVVTVSDDGHWRDGAAGGHGLAMASGLADELRIRRTARGTEIELRHELRRAVPLFQVARETGPDERATSTDGELHTEVTPGRLVVAGALDELNAEVFGSALRQATRGGTTDTTIDLTGLTLLASPGIQALLTTFGDSRRTGSRVRLVARSGCAADRVLNLIGIPHTG